MQPETSVSEIVRFHLPSELIVRIVLPQSSEVKVSIWRVLHDPHSAWTDYAKIDYVPPLFPEPQLGRDFVHPACFCQRDPKEAYRRLA